ncbi:MTRF1L release factor glutamine methyltransferase [Engraulis encrasicolus]|uniref:MTRF1L release factor glutamine methyltransferase n=1 Tax=Engraulis encrasicolus TaxID=184585 RepID=UPI002FD4BB0A
MLFRPKILGLFLHPINRITLRQVSTARSFGEKVIPPVSSPPSSSKLTVQQALDKWTVCFQVAGVSESVLSSQHIVSHVLGHKTLNSLSRKGLSRVLSQPQVERIWKLCHKRLTRMPVQYVIEEWDFRDLTLKMKPPVFIPRPETEELVGLVLADLEESRVGSRCPDSHVHFLEVGCGSGAISLSLLHSHTQIRGMAVDQSAEAVALTKENAQSLGLHDRLTVNQADVIKDAEWLMGSCGRVEVLVSNPPYLFTEDLESLEPEIHRYEDRAALDGGRQGMCVIEQILTLAPSLLADCGRVYLEVDPRHPELIQMQLRDNRLWGLDYVATHKDFTNRPRFCILQRRPGNG